MVRYITLLRIGLSIGLGLALFVPALIFPLDDSATRDIGSDYPSVRVVATKAMCDDGRCRDENNFTSESIRDIYKREPAVEAVGADLGEPQIIHKMAAKVIQRVEKARKYIQETVMVEPQNENALTVCRNQNARCAFWAVQGQCDKNMSGYMKKHCAPVCFSCEELHREAKCLLDLNAKSAWLPGDLNLMFERISSDPSFKQYTPKVLSRPTFVGKDTHATADYQLGPWVLLLEDFVSAGETERIIQVGHDLGYQQSSTYTGTFDKAGKIRAEVSSRRTSTNAWCDIELCDTDPLINGVYNRIEGLTQIPHNNSEHLQLLRYEEGQFYKIHNDYIHYERGSIQGVRILTIFLYLSDVEDGGGTNFPELENMTVQPKQGRAVIWPSVLDAFPHQADPRTNHQALPVIKGLKYGANAWLHQRDIKTQEIIGCLQRD
jgi:prolyl 4-hydroxylase